MRRIGESQGIINPALQGKSTQNTRIERFWKDTNRTVTSRFKVLFQQMEAMGIIVVGGYYWEFQRSVLVKIFLPRIQQAMKDFIQF